jgi:Ca-activated chloride channel homolog
MVNTMFLHCAYANLIYVFAPLLALFIVYRLRFYKHPVYMFPLTQLLANHGMLKKPIHKKVYFFLRLGILAFLIFLIMRPQWVDERSRVNVDGVDIVLAIDVSGSMAIIDDPKDQKTRIDAAKSEAIRFIERRNNDPMGVVIFGKEALSLCPITLDKQVLKDMVGGLELGVINSEGTWLGTGLATAVNRLKNSKSKSKVIILLTDGNPTPPEKVEPEMAISLAQKFGIKVYTIGIGNKQGGFVQTPFFGLQQVREMPLNEALLDTIAKKTGGQFFRAQNQHEMRSIYDTIDHLEKTKIETNIFHHYYEAFATFLWIVLLLFGIELALKFFVWRGVW